MDKSDDENMNPETWVDLYGDLLYSYAYGRSRDVHLAEEAVQETFARGVSKLSSFSGKSSVKSWLFGILRNVLREHARKAKPSEIFEEDNGLQWELAGGSGGVTALRTLSPLEAVQRLEFWELVEACLAKLPAKTAQVFWEKEVKGVSTPDIAKATGISPGNIWVRLHRARVFMQECLSNMLKLGPKEKHSEKDDAND